MVDGRPIAICAAIAPAYGLTVSSFAPRPVAAANGAATAVMAVSQWPVTLSCLGTPSGPAGWKTLPSWYMVASNDNAIPPAAERAMAARAGAHTVEISSSHVAFISHPQETTDLILAAVQGS